MRRLSKLWCLMCLSALLFVITEGGCVHKESYLKQTDFPNRPFQYIVVDQDTKSKSVTVTAALDAKTGTEFAFPSDDATIRFGDGQVIKVNPRIASVQKKMPVEEKFPRNQGYDFVRTKQEDVWLVRKNEKVMYGVVVEAKDQKYDARSKVENLNLATLYKCEDPEDAYTERQIVYEFTFPDRKMDFEIEGFKVAVDSTNYPAKTLKYGYKGEGGLDLRVAP